MKILVFTEGTATKHPSPEGFLDVPSFIPTTGAVERLTGWWRQGAVICYLTSERWNEDPTAVQDTLRRFGFPPGELSYRQEGEGYVDVVERVRPDVLIEDDCKSIGWDEVIGPRLRPEWGIRSIIVAEFGGLAHLPERCEDLMR